MTDIKFSPPTPESKGFARRNYTAARFMEMLTAMQTAKTDEEKTQTAFTFLNAMPDMVKFIAPYIAVTPGAGDPPMTAETYLWDEADQQQFMDFLTAVMGGGQGDAIPPVSSAPSATT